MGNLVDSLLLVAVVVSSLLRMGMIVQTILTNGFPRYLAQRELKLSFVRKTVKSLIVSFRAHRLS
ncbi:hypothetical protein Plhal304r1_c010g0041381 [Plasmopara halstedii]